MNSIVGLIKVKMLVKPQHKDAVNCQASEISLKMYGDSMVTSLSCVFLGQNGPFRQWLAALAFVYSLATVEQAHRMPRSSFNGHVSALLLLAAGLSTCQETFGHYWTLLALHFAPLFYYQLYLPILLALYFAFCRCHAILFTDTFQRC